MKTYIMGYFKVFLTGQLVVVISGICHDGLDAFMRKTVRHKHLLEMLLVPVSVWTS